MSPRASLELTWSAALLTGTSLPTATVMEYLHLALRPLCCVPPLLTRSEVSGLLLGEPLQPGVPSLAFLPLLRTALPPPLTPWTPYLEACLRSQNPPCGPKSSASFFIIVRPLGFCRGCALSG